MRHFRLCEILPKQGGGRGGEGGGGRVALSSVLDEISGF